MVSVDLVRAPGLFSGTPYADAAVVAPGARLLLLAGSCPLDEEGRTVAAGDLAGQTRVCIANARAALAAADATVEDIAYVRVHVASADSADLALAWRVLREELGDHEPPGTLTGVTVLGWPDQLVEVEVTAALAT